MSEVIRPLGDRLVVRPAPAEEKSPGGILLPDAAKKKPRRGEVLAVGPGSFETSSNSYIPLDVKVGDVVLYGEWSGTEVKECGDVVILREDDVLGVIERR